MITHAIYYECPGCGHTENAPRTGLKRDVQPVDNLAESRRRKEPPGDAWDSEFALAVVPPAMATEFRWLCIVGSCAVLLSVVPWGLFIWTGVVADLDELFVMCWQISVLGFVILALALLHPARFMKQLGIVAAVLMIPVCIYGDVLISGMINAQTANQRTDIIDAVGNGIAAHTFVAAAVYCVWLAWYLIRERRLQGW